MSPFEGDGVWLRCALHAHTTNSDGEMSPDMLVRHYEWAGFDVLAITDHWVRTVERSTRKLHLFGIEVWNAGCELEIGRGDASVHWDEALEAGHALSALATDDSHHPGYDSGFAWTIVRVPERTQEAVLEGLRTGRFYGSTAPAIHDVEHDDGFVTVRCSPAESVTLVSSRYRGARANAGRLGYPKASTILERDAAGRITACRLERPPLASYGRVEVADEAGGRLTMRTEPPCRAGRRAGASSVAPIARLSGLPASFHRTRPSRQDRRVPL